MSVGNLYTKSVKAASEASQSSGLTTLISTQLGTKPGLNAANNFSNSNSFPAITVDGMGIGLGGFLNSGVYNVSCGNNIMPLNQGSYSVALGHYSLHAATGVDGCIAIGYNSQVMVTTGSYNTAVGLGTLSGATTGTNNTALGNSALSLNTAYSNTTGIGNNAQVGGNNQLRLGDTTVTVYTQSGSVSASDIRDKADIRDTVLGLDFIKSLRPVDYKWDIRLDYAPSPPPLVGPDATPEEREAYTQAVQEYIFKSKPENLVHDGTHKRSRYHHGLIAQEVGALGVDFGGYQNFEVNGGEALQAVVYEELIAPMIKAIQELSAENKMLKAHLGL